MATANRAHEQTINVALGEVLESLGRAWTVRSEEPGAVEGGGRLDVLIEKRDGWPVVIEAEVGNHHQAEIEAQSRLGRRLTATGHTIHAAVALVHPDALRKFSGAKLRSAISTTAFEFALYSTAADGSMERFPRSGWLTGGVTSLAVLLHRSSIPAWRVEALATALETGVRRTEGALSAAHPVGSPLGVSIGNLLGQSDDAGHQTRRMAMTVVVDALVFHAALAEAQMQVRDLATSQQRSVQAPSMFRSGGAFLPSRILDEWESILEVNYWPIFHTAKEVIRLLPPQTQVATLGLLWATAEELVAGGVTKSHDLTGIVFQRLIADRKFLATYYTRPSAAALLVSLALPLDRPIKGSGWADVDALGSMRVADFACGTGTLLSTAYQRLALLHEVHGEDPRALHPQMMAHGLVGLDVLTVAVHLTAAMLAGSFPDVPFAGECLLTMPYGSYPWGPCVGSLELLDEQIPFDIIETAAQTAGGRGANDARDLMLRIGHGQFDLVIMNPPFTRHGAREGDRTEVHNPAFAAFGADEALQDRLSNRLKRLARDGHAHGHAGLASYFVDLADRKIADGGTLALVLPMSALSGASWEEVRQLWRDRYSSLLVVTIAERGSGQRSFSADTDIAECLIVATKGQPVGIERRATFVVLNDQPTDTLRGEVLAEAVRKALAGGNVRRLEEGPYGGTRLTVGEATCGEVIDCPLPADGPWPVTGISDLTLGQTAHQLSQGRLWIEGMPHGTAAAVPMTRIADVCRRVGFHDIWLSGAGIERDGLPKGPFEILNGVPAGAAYPCLWNHQTTRERSLVVPPDSHARVRAVAGRMTEMQVRADGRWASATRAHYNRDLQFNAQSLIVAMTPAPALGGRAWPSVIFEAADQEYAFALWCNSTLGLLCHWWTSNKSQSGRGSTTVSAIPDVLTLDVRALSAAQHERARAIFGELSPLRFLPFDQVDEDPARAELDRKVIIDLLGLDPSLCDAGGPMDRLRQKLAVEPQIRADKATRVVFTETGEAAAQR